MHKLNGLRYSGRLPTNRVIISINIYEEPTSATVKISLNKEKYPQKYQVNLLGVEYSAVNEQFTTDIPLYPLYCSMNFQMMLYFHGGACH